MHNTNLKAIVGELKSMTEFVKLGYTIFAPVSDGNDPFDFIAYKNKNLIKVEVKSTSVSDRPGTYTATISSTRSNNTSTKIKYFDPNNCDILSIYIVPLDIVCFIKSNEIESKKAIVFREKPSNSVYMKNHKQRVISDYINLKKILS